MSLSTRDGIPARLVVEVLRRWMHWEPETHTYGNAASRTGLSENWFYRLREESPDRLIPIYSLDLLLTGLELQHEWPSLTEASPPEELADRWCRGCTRNVMATIPDYRCVWCGSTTFLPKPPDYVFEGGPKLGSTLRAITEEQLEEAWGFYQQGYSLRQVVDIMWPRLKYATKPTAMGAIRLRWVRRGKKLRSVAELNRARCTTHGRARMVRKGEPGFEEYQAYCHEQHMAWYYQGREKCRHEGCDKYALRGAWRKREGRNVLDSDYCRWHTPGERDRTASWLVAARQRGEVPLATIRPLLDVWKAQPHGMRDLAAASGVPRSTIYRWAYRWADEKLIKRELAAKVEAVGLPSTEELPTAVDEDGPDEATEHQPRGAGREHASHLP